MPCGRECPRHGRLGRRRPILELALLDRDLAEACERLEDPLLAGGLEVLRDRSLERRLVLPGNPGRRLVEWDSLDHGGHAERTPSPLQKWAPSGRMLVDDRFGLEKFTEGNLSPFTSISRHLVASERGLRIFRRAINKHHPRLKSGGHVIRAFLAC